MSEPVLTPADAARLLALRPQSPIATASPDVLADLAGEVAAVLRVAAVFVAEGDGHWSALAAHAPAGLLPEPDARAWSELDERLGATKGRCQPLRWLDRTWTFLRITRRVRPGVALLLEGDWSASRSLLRQFTRELGRIDAPSSQRTRARAAAVHRLTRDLGRLSGTRDVCATALQQAVRLVPSRLGAFAVRTAVNQDELTIIATHGYPAEVVRDIRVLPGHGVLGTVYRDRAPLWVTDVTRVSPLRRRTRPRYRTNSFLAVPVLSGRDVLGVVCLTDRMDERPFTYEDLSLLCELLAPAGLALAREAARREAEHFARAAALDPLTGLMNRGHFERRLWEELQRAGRHQTTAALVMLDIDDFKAINDKWGHVVGDDVLRSVAEILTRSVRLFDVCARYGGEEFAVIMPGVDAAGAARIAERIRQQIAAQIPAGGAVPDLKVTASLGVSAAGGGGVRELIEAADRALYEAKHMGKNVVRRSAALPGDPPAAAPGEAAPGREF